MHVCTWKKCGRLHGVNDSAKRFRNAIRTFDFVTRFPSVHFVLTDKFPTGLIVREGKRIRVKKKERERERKEGRKRENESQRGERDTWGRRREKERMRK